MATHSSVLAWRIPGMEEPGGLPSMGSHRVGHDWSDLAAAAAAATWRRGISDKSNLGQDDNLVLGTPFGDVRSGGKGSKVSGLRFWQGCMVMWEADSRSVETREVLCVFIKRSVFIAWGTQNQIIDGIEVWELHTQHLRGMCSRTGIPPSESLILLVKIRTGWHHKLLGKRNYNEVSPHYRMAMI